MTQLGWLGENFNGNAKEISFKAQFIRTENPHGENLGFPQYEIIKDASQLKAYNEAEGLGINEGFIKATQKYTEKYFENNILFIAHIEEGSGSNTHKITSVTGTKNKTNVYIDTITPEAGTCDMAYHRIVIEMKKSDTENTDFELFFNGKKASGKTKEITANGENANISLSLPENWNYTEEKNENSGFGLSIYHEEDSENNVTINFSEAFGVCGTGLRTEETVINNYKATMGIYDGAPTFSYIVFDNTAGYYVIYNNADALWWQKHEEDLREIFSTLRIAGDAE